MKSNAQKIAEDAMRGAETYKLEQPRPLMREMPPADPFPLGALGDVLKPAAEAIQDKIQAPAAICGQSVLAAAALVVQGLKNVDMPNGQTRPVVESFMTVAGTGERKSSCDAEALRPIREHEKALREKYIPELAEYQNHKEAWDTARAKIKSKAKGDKGAIKRALDDLGRAPEPPLHPIISCSDMTIEGLCKLMVNGQPSMGFFSAEGGQFIGGHGMSQDHKIKTASTLSLFWDGGSIDRIRAGDGFTVLTGRRCTTHLMAQPDIAAVMLTDPVLKDQGLLSRFLVTAPQSTSGTRPWREPKPETEGAIQRYEAHLLDVLRLPLPLAEGKTNELAPPSISLSVEAYPVWVKFHDHIEGNAGNGKPLAPIRGLANKLPEHAIRLAAVLTLLSDPQAGTVLRPAMEAGIMLAEHYAKEALRLFETSAIDRNLLTAQTLLTWLLTGWDEGFISLPDIYQKGPPAIRSRKMAEGPVRLLEEHGWLVPAGSGIVAGEQRREIWRIVKGTPAHA